MADDVTRAEDPAVAGHAFAGSAIESINAVTLATHDMARAVTFYRALGFDFQYGGESASFSSFRIGAGHLNLILAATDASWSWWGRVIFYVADVDAIYERVIRLGLQPEAPPRDAEWRERYFQIRDPDGHELSFARPLGGSPQAVGATL